MQRNVTRHPLLTMDLVPWTIGHDKTNKIPSKSGEIFILYSNENLVSVEPSLQFVSHSSILYFTSLHFTSLDFTSFFTIFRAFNVQLCGESVGAGLACK